MEAIFKRLGMSGGKGLLGTRQGTLLVAAAAAICAGVVLAVFLNGYRSESAGGPVSIFVADRVIPAGTAGDVIATDNLFKLTPVPAGRAQDGALTDASELAGKVAVSDIYPGEQITAGDFKAADESIRGRLSGSQRAMSIPLDGAHGLVGHIRSGDHVDVLAGFTGSSAATGRGRPLLRTLVRDVLVLNAPELQTTGKVGGRGTSNIVVRVGDRQAAELAFAADNGKVWFVLRPPAGATESERSPSVSLDSLLLDSKPIEVSR